MKRKPNKPHPESQTHTEPGGGAAEPGGPAFGAGSEQAPGAAGTSGQSGAVDKVTFILVLTNKKDAHRRHPACFIIRFRFNAVADKRQWSSAASKPRRKTRAKLCSRFCAENEPSHQTCRSFSASR